VTIDVQDAKDVKTNLENADGTGKLSFTGKVGEIAYDLNLALLKEIDATASQVSVSPRNIFVVIHKVQSLDREQTCISVICHTTGACLHRCLILYRSRWVTGIG